MSWLKLQKVKQSNQTSIQTMKSWEKCKHQVHCKGIWIMNRIPRMFNCESCLNGIGIQFSRHLLLGKNGLPLRKLQASNPPYGEPVAELPLAKPHPVKSWSYSKSGLTPGKDWYIDSRVLPQKTSRRAASWYSKIDEYSKCPKNRSKWLGISKNFQ